jgi:hypothetical protein
MAMEGADFSQNRRVISAWRWRLAREPAENVAVLGFEQEFIIVEFTIAKVADFGIGETAKQEIHFAHAAMPGAEQNAPLPDIELQTLRLRARHDLSSRQETIRPRRAAPEKAARGGTL